MKPFKRYLEDKLIILKKYIKINLDNKFIILNIIKYTSPILFIKKLGRGIQIYINY